MEVSVCEVSELWLIASAFFSSAGDSIDRVVTGESLSTPLPLPPPFTPFAIRLRLALVGFKFVMMLPIK